MRFCLMLFLRKIVLKSYKNLFSDACDLQQIQYRYSCYKESFILAL
jgi:hypothetical protein